MCFRPGTISALKKCPDCGYLNEAEDSVCQKCGAKLPEQSGITDLPPIPGAPGAPTTPRAPDNNALPLAPKAPGEE